MCNVRKIYGVLTYHGITRGILHDALVDYKALQWHFPVGKSISMGRNQ